MSKSPFRPFRQTFTTTYKGCLNIRRLLSPASDDAMKDLVVDFTEILTYAGFKIARDDASGAYKTVFHRFYEPGKEYGYTLGTVLEASDASVHTYPEACFGRSYEIEYNLCFLEPDVEARHKSCIDRARLSLGKYLLPTDVLFEASPRRYFD